MQMTETTTTTTLSLSQETTTTTTQTTTKHNNNAADEPRNDDNNNANDNEANDISFLISYHETTYQLEEHHHQVWSKAWAWYSFIQLDDAVRLTVLSQYGDFNWIETAHFRLRDTDITVSFYPDEDAMVFSGTNVAAVNQIHDAWHHSNNGLDNH